MNKPLILTLLSFLFFFPALDFKLNAQLKSATSSALSIGNHPLVAGGPPMYIIPVVFHVLYQQSIDDISDAQVIDAVNILNQDWRKRNADTSDVIPQFKNRIGDTKIEFRLATKDPNGNCTNGIEHIYTSLTTNAGDASKINQWPRGKYLNIWVVNSILLYGYQVGGLSYYPPDVTGQNSIYDGVMMINSYTGSIGTSAAWSSRGLDLEIAKYLGLWHTWGQNDGCGIACGDDGIADTPITKGWCSCPLPQNAKICDTAIVENYQNFMEYSYCTRMFTQGQAIFLQQAMTNPVDQRDSLSTNYNHLNTGTDSTDQANIPNCPPVADFTSNRTSVCQGSAVFFTDHSWRSTPTKWFWKFSNGTPDTSTAQNAAVIFNTPGLQSVTLTVSNSAGTDSVRLKNFVFVSSSNVDHTGLYSENFENTDFNSDTLWAVQTDKSLGPAWKHTDTAAFSGVYSVMLPSFNGTDIGFTSDFITPLFDLSSCVPNATQLNFKYSCASSAPDTSSITENLKIYTSNNCGASWLLRKTISGFALASGGYDANYYIPASKAMWNSASFTIPNANLTGHTRFKFEYNSSPYSNNIYIDDINISSTVGVDEMQNNFTDLNMSPNPSAGNNTIIISYLLPAAERISISLIDIIGRRINIMEDKQESAGLKTVALNKSDLNLRAGIYIVRISDGRSSAVKKLVITD